MAVDEALLEAALERDECFVRWYRWSVPTISLGYFQEAAAAAAPRFVGLPVVRRLTGGGAILHHLELTYSCAIAANHPLAHAPHQLYDAVHERIIDVLRGHGISARPRGLAVRQEQEPFLCFGRGDRRDVLVDADKVLGSAQRRRRGAVLQHGSLVLNRSPFAPEFPGVLDLLPEANFGVDQVDELGAALASLFGSRHRFGELDERDSQRARSFVESRYEHLDWRTVRPTR
jgi:lipoate-protein ligase A